MRACDTVDGIFKPCEYQKSPFEEILDKITSKGVAGCSEPCCMHNQFRVFTMPTHHPPVTPSNLATLRTPISTHPGYTSQHPLSMGSSTPLIPSQRPLSYQTPFNVVQKCKWGDNKENKLLHLLGYTQTSTSVKKQKPYSARKTTPEKLEVVFTAIEEAKWGLGEFLYEVFWLKNEDGDKVHRSKRHAGWFSAFCRGILGTHLQ